MNARRLTTNAVGIALFVLLSYVSIDLAFLKLTFASFPIIVSSLLGRRNRCGRDWRVHPPAFDLWPYAYNGFVDDPGLCPWLDHRPVRAKAWL